MVAEIYARQEAANQDTTALRASACVPQIVIIMLGLAGQATVVEEHVLEPVQAMVIVI